MACAQRLVNAKQKRCQKPSTSVPVRLFRVARSIQAAAQTPLPQVGSLVFPTYRALHRLDERLMFATVGKGHGPSGAGRYPYLPATGKLVGVRARLQSSSHRRYGLSNDASSGFYIDAGDSLSCVNHPTGQRGPKNISKPPTISSSGPKKLMSRLKRNTAVNPTNRAPANIGPTDSFVHAP